MHAGLQWFFRGMLAAAHDHHPGMRPVKSPSALSRPACGPASACSPPARHAPPGRWRGMAAVLASALIAGTSLQAQPVGSTGTPGASTTPGTADSTVLDAREAARRKDRARLAATIAALQAGNHPLLPWAEYWDLQARLREAGTDDIEAFTQRWPGSFVEERLRADWLAELGRRRDFAAFAREYPRLRATEDRELRCWLLLTEHLAGKDVAEPARAAWLAQRETDDGCNMLATAMVDGRRFSADDVWLKARLSVEHQRPAAARAAIGLLNHNQPLELTEALDQPTRYLRRPDRGGRFHQELRLLALMRLAANEPADAQVFMADARLTSTQAAWAWVTLGRQTAFRLAPEALGHYQRALAEGRTGAGFSDETLAWGVRAALRQGAPAQRWPLVLRLIDQMSPAAQRDAAWVYWKAQALRGTAREGAEGEVRRVEARQLLAGIAGPLHFYAQLAAEALDQPPAWPPTPEPATEAERSAARSHPGLQRALLLLDLGLRSEGLREWNFSLRSLDDRGLHAAARLACDRANWQLCINTAERSRQDIDLALRYPMPYVDEIRAAAARAEVDLPLVLGLIRQETRFMTNLRSHAGASGVMQVMPATAQIVARKLGFSCCTPAQLNDPALNLRLGTQYLRWALDDMGGSQAMAAAAYNAGPGRPRRWREGATVEAAAWAEGIPFNETRDYVKRVLANAAVYQGLLSGRPPSLRPRLGQTIGPRDGGSATTQELP